MEERNLNKEASSFSSMSMPSSFFSSTSMPSINAGQIIHKRYRLVRELGHGGFGSVYEAEHIYLRRPHAIKILLKQYARDQAFRGRFLREAQTAASLVHKNIIHIDDFGIEANQPFLVMPYIFGGTLQIVIQNHQSLRLAQVLSYLEDICAALGYAHSKGVVHLDLKPQNLLVHQDDGRLILADFGLAHLLTGDEVLGGESRAFGTPAYMAPEHMMGQPEKRSDIYALGILLYQMLTGLLPPRNSSQQRYAPSMVRQELRPAIDAVVQKAVAYNVMDRYKSAQEFLQAAKNALDKNQPKQTQPPPKQAQAAPPPKQTPPKQGAAKPTAKAEKKKKQEQTPKPAQAKSAKPRSGQAGLAAQTKQKDFSWQRLIQVLLPVSYGIFVLVCLAGTSRLLFVLNPKYKPLSVPTGVNPALYTTLFSLWGLVLLPAASLMPGLLFDWWCGALVSLAITLVSVFVLWDLFAACFAIYPWLTLCAPLALPITALVVGAIRTNSRHARGNPSLALRAARRSGSVLLMFWETTIIIIGSIPYWVKANSPADVPFVLVLESILWLITALLISGVMSLVTGWITRLLMRGITFVGDIFK